jgi:uncharacterized protein YbjT (DUF2867 family)
LNILLTGASGFVGRILSQILIKNGHQVRPVSRSQGFDFNQLQTEMDWEPLLNNIDVVINAAGIIGEKGNQRFDLVHKIAPIALFNACTKAGVQKIIQISALGADKHAFTKYHLSKRAADDHLRTLDLNWFVLRPSLIYGLGGGSQKWFMQLAALPMIPIIGNGQQLLQPVHISDLIAVVMQCLVSPKAQLTLNVVGPKPITYADWLQQMRLAQQLKPTRFVFIPYKLALVGAYFGQFFSALLQPDNFRMLQAGNFADAEPIKIFLGREPVIPTPKLFFSNTSDIKP